MPPLRACLLLLCLASTALADPAIVRHRVSVELDATATRIVGSDELTVRRDGDSPLDLRLNSGLTISTVLVDGGALEEDVVRISDNGSEAVWRVPLPPGEEARALVSVSFSGSLVTFPGSIRPPGGALITEDDEWLPTDGGRAHWELRLDIPAGLRAIVPGRREQRAEAAGRAVETWTSAGLRRRMDLALTPMLPSEAEVDGVTVATWKPEAGTLDPALAAAVRDALGEFTELLGPYPLPRLDIVPTGGAHGRIEPGLLIASDDQIRAFGLRESLLAAWFGGSLGDDGGRGAWAAGLRAYLLFHYLPEADAPDSAREFRLAMCARLAAGPVPGFDGLRTAASFHALRREAGDAAFRRTLVEVVRERAGDELTWSDWGAELARHAKRDLTAPVSQWALRPGGPKLLLTYVGVESSGGRQRVVGTIQQPETRTLPAWRLSVPIVVETIDGREETLVEVSGRETRFSILAPSLALRIALDPDLQVPRQIDALRPVVWRPLLPDVRSGSDPRRVTALMRQLGETDTPWRVLRDALVIAGFDVEEHVDETTVLARSEGWSLLAGDTPVRGALPLTASPPTPEDGTHAAGIALDPGDDLERRALLVDLPSVTPDVLEFVRGTASIAASSGASLLLLRLPEQPPENYDDLWRTPEDFAEADREARALRAQLRRAPTLPIPAFVVPHAFSAEGALTARVVWTERRLEAASLSVAVDAERGRGSDLVVVAPVPDANDASAAVAVIEAAQILFAHRDLLGRSVRIEFVRPGAGAVVAEERIARRRAKAPGAPALRVGRVGDRGVATATLRSDDAGLARVVAAAFQRATIDTASDLEEVMSLGPRVVWVRSAGPDGPGSEPGAKKIGRVARGLALAIIGASIAP